MASLAAAVVAALLLLAPAAVLSGQQVDCLFRASLTGQTLQIWGELLDEARHEDTQDVSLQDPARAMSVSSKGFRGAALLLLGLALCACTYMEKLSPRRTEKEKQAQQLQELQQKSMRFADEYVGQLTVPLQALVASSDSPSDRLAAQSWVYSQANSAYTVASGANPISNALDLVVLATLSRMVIEDSWVTERFGERAIPLRDAHRALEARAWEIVSTELTDAQKQQLRTLINDWRKKNPDVRAVASIHFHEFAKSTGQPASGGVQGSGSLFGLVGLDPLSNLDPAVREITQTRLLAERTVYFAQRMPTLLEMQVARLSYQLAAMPETRQALANLDQASRAAQQAGNLAETLPAVIAGERQAAIEQFMNELSAQQVKIRALLGELTAALQAGGATSDSLNATIRSFDTLMRRFDKPSQPGAPPQPPGKPFDITAYTDAAKQLAVTTRELAALIQAVDSGAPGVARLGQGATDEARRLLDFAFWRIIGLIAFLAAATLGVLLGYRWITHRNRAS